MKPKRWRKPPVAPLTAHFRWSEAVCHCCGLIPDAAIVREQAERMEGLREFLGNHPIYVTSWCRCPEYNASLDGAAPNSLHKTGVATDFAVRRLAPAEVQRRLADHPGGLGSYAGFTHVDWGPRRRW